MNEKNWIPEMGKIVVHHVLGVHVNNIAFRFRTEADEPQHYRELATLSSFVGIPSGVVQIDAGPQYEYQKDAPQLVIRRYAENNDIVALYSLWANEYVSDWVTRVIREETALHPDEARRLRSLLALSRQLRR